MLIESKLNHRAIAKQKFQRNFKRALSRARAFHR